MFSWWRKRQLLRTFCVFILSLAKRALDDFLPVQVHADGVKIAGPIYAHACDTKPIKIRVEVPTGTEQLTLVVRLCSVVFLNVLLLFRSQPYIQIPFQTSCTEIHIIPKLD